LRKTNFAEMRCSLARGLSLIGDWWSPLILRSVFLGVVRFDDLVEDLGISRNLLTIRLRALMRSKIMERKPYQQRPRRYEYGLTDAGRELIPILIALTAWGDRWATPREGIPILFVHDTCRHRFEPRIICSECGDTVDVGDVRAEPGPGGSARKGTMVIARRLAAAGSNRR
jgi:DNA-binding HxlR family transcriptional regulator